MQWKARALAYCLAGLSLHASILFVRIEEHYLKQSARAFINKARSVRVSHSRDLDSNLFTSHFDRNKTWSGAQFVSERSSVLVFLPGVNVIIL